MSYQPPSRTRFYRDKRNGKFMGICAGLADYTGLDVTLIRFGLIASVFLSSGSILAVYFIAGMVSPDRSSDHLPLPDNKEDRDFWRSVRRSPTRTVRDLRLRLNDINRRLGDIEGYVTNENRTLAREIEQLR